MTNHDKRTAKAQAALAAAGLSEITVDVDDENNFYLSGFEDDPDRQADAVSVAIAEGADVVRDGIDTPNEAVPNLERHFSVGASQHLDPGEVDDTPEQVILKGADLSGRIFHLPDAAPLLTGTPLIPK